MRKASPIVLRVTVNVSAGTSDVCPGTEPINIILTEYQVRAVREKDGAGALHSMIETAGRSDTERTPAPRY